MHHLHLLKCDRGILNLWGLQNDSSNVAVLDEERICRYRRKGKIPDSEKPRILALIKEYYERHASGRGGLHIAAPLLTELGAQVSPNP